MATKPGRLKRVETREVTFGVYELRLTPEDLQRFEENRERFLTELLEEEGEPAPNELLFNEEGARGVLDDLFAPKTEGGGGGGSGNPPTAIVFHQESGQHISRYLTMVVTT